MSLSFSPSPLAPLPLGKGGRKGEMRCLRSTLRKHLISPISPRPLGGGVGGGGICIYLQEN